MHIRDEKELTRTRIAERAKRLTEKERQAESRSICRRVIENLPEGTEHLTVCAYYPMATEADIRPAIEELLKRGHSVFMPRFTRVHFEFREITTLDDLIPGTFGLREPLASNPPLAIHDVSIVLIPAVGFDRSGHRLGRGNGGYDRFLKELRAANPQALVWGMALEHQLTDTVPTEPHDEKVDAIMTAHQMIPCSPEQKTDHHS